MEKIIGILILSFLWLSNANAGINEPGTGYLYSGLKACKGALKSEHKKLKKIYLEKDRKINVILYASCNAEDVVWGIKKGKNLETLHQKAYKSCLKSAKKYMPDEDCYLYAVNEEKVWKYDKAKESNKKKVKLAKAKAELAEAKVLEEKQAQLDKRPGRFFEDQPDVNDDYQIHFIYMLAADGKDREYDINGKIEKYAEQMNKLHEKHSQKVKGSSGAKKYKFDYRKDGKLDVTFIRLDKKRKKLNKHINNNYRGWLWMNGFNNPKKHYFTFADVKSPDGGEGGVGMASVFLKSKYNRKAVHMIRTAVHELHHGMGGGFACVPGMSGTAHWSGNRQDTIQLQIFMGKAYVHDEEGCPKGEDSAYLTPTSKDPYDPFKLICLNEWGKYNHPKLVKLREKQANDLKKGKWNYRGGGSGCKFTYWDRDGSGGMKIFDEQEAKRAYERH